ncbi:MAG: hypothetical protein NTV06_04355 [candidate division Zixibacteria bacterium]|nr:hypothetical protein [candidate division Zixibacteria bacterium]
MSHHREKEKLKAQNAESEETLTSKTVTEAGQGNIEIHSATSTEIPSEKNKDLQRKYSDSNTGSNG